MKKQKGTRQTLNKQIAAAPTHAKKWEIALHGGKPPTAIQQLPSEAYGLRGPSAHGEEWRNDAIKRAKQRFADLLFPALMNDDPRPFEELLEAMASRRKTEVSWEEFVRRLAANRQKKPTKKEAGRRLRLGLLNLKPDDLVSMQKVLAFLEKCEVDCSDESHVRRVMRELEICLLKPGDTVYFWFAEFDLAPGLPKLWHCVRKLTVGRNGTTTNVGMSQKDYDNLRGRKSHRVESKNGPDK